MEVLHGVGAAVSAAFAVTNTLILIGQAIAEVDRTLQQLQREVTDLQETMERMGQDFSGPVGTRLLRSNTGSLGNHWRAVLKIIERANRTLSEMESCLRKVPHQSGGNWSRPLRAAWLNFKNSDIEFYRNEIQILTRNMHFELTMVLVCRDMDGLTNGATGGFQVNLIDTEDEWTRLQKDVVELQSSSRRRPVRSASTRQLETAKEIQEYLSTASDLLSTASTVCAEPYQRSEEPYRRSFGDEIEQPAQRQADIRAYIEEQQHRSYSGNPSRTRKPMNGWLFALLLLPRILAGGTLLTFQLIFYGFVCLYLLIILFPVLIFTCCINCKDRWKGNVRDFVSVNAWFGKIWRLLLGISELKMDVRVDEPTRA